MNKESLTQVIMSILGTNKREIVNRKTGWLNIPCPLAPWTHEKKRDRSPSFGIKIEDDDESFCMCFTCKFNGKLHELVSAYANHTGKDLNAEIDQIEQDEFFNLYIPDYEDLDQLNEEMHQTRSIPTFDTEVEEWELGMYYPADGDPYLEDREIDDQTVKDIGLLVDESDSEGDFRILFPVRDLDGICRGLSGRAVSKDARIRVRDYSGLDKRKILLGLHTLPEELDHIELVEGLFDYARGVQYGRPVLCSLHANLTEEQANWLIYLNVPVICMYDRDKAGVEGVAKVYDRLLGHVPLLNTEYPKRYVYNEGKGINELVGDPDELTLDEWEQMVEKADIYEPPPKY